MPPAVLIIESREEVAAALEGVIASARMYPIVVPHLEHLTDLATMPAAIIVRIAFESVSDPPHLAIQRLPHDRPPIVAIACEEDELNEAHRLRCDVVLRAPEEIGRLCEVVMKLIDAV